MILTGKAKEDFYKFLIKKFPLNEKEVEKWFMSLYNEFKSALIIEFFFSKDLHITGILDGELNLKYILTPISENCFLQEQIISENNFSLDILLCKIEAIKKANKIYNSK